MSRMVMGFELRTAIDELTHNVPYTTRREVHDRFFPEVSWENFDKTLSNCAMDGLVVSWPYKNDRMLALTDEGRELAFRPPRRPS